MKPDLSHDLKENDLLAFLTNLKAWWARYGTWIMAVVVLVLGVWVAKRYIEHRRITLREEHWGELDTVTSPEVARMLAQDYDHPGFQAKAFLTAGDLVLARLVQDRPAEEKELADLVQQATAMYQKVLEVPEAALVFRLNAWLGLASVAEERKDWESAADLYKQVREQAKGKFPVLERLAASRAELLPRLAMPVTFAPDPLPPAQGPLPLLDLGAPAILPPLDLSPIPGPGAAEPPAPPALPVAPQIPAPPPDTPAQTTP